MESNYSKWADYLQGAQMGKITAEEARKRNDHYAISIQLNYDEIDKRIEKLSDSGKSEAYVDLSKVEMSYRERVYEFLKEEYAKRNFGVKRQKDSGGGAYDDSPSDYAVITW